MDTENRWVVARGRGWEVGEMGEGGQKVQTSSYKINKSWDVTYSMATIGNNTVANRVDLKSLHHKTKIFGTM